MFDILIRDGRIFDGSGNPGYRADVGLTDGHIAAIGRMPEAAAAQVIEAAGDVVCPGFVDVHVHSELVLLDGSEGGAGVLQGVTSQVIAADGLSYAPLSRDKLLEMRQLHAGTYGQPDIGWDFATVAEYLAKFEGLLPNNILFQVPHAAIRLEVMGWDDRPATAEEIRRMQALINQAIDEGAASFATILDTPPCCWADTQELIDLCQVAAKRGAIFAPHIRYPLGILAAIQEVLEVAEKANIPLHIAHHYNELDINAPLEEAQARGVDVTFDAYPYWAGCTTLLGCLPLWMRQGSPTDIKARLADPKARQQLQEEGLAKPSLESWQLAAVEPESNHWMEGQTVGQVVETLGADLVNWACDTLQEADLRVTIISLGAAQEEWMLKAITHPLHMTCTDGVFLGSHPHPRSYSTYPRLLGRYVREKGTLTWEQAIRKCSSFPAQRYNLADRGLIKRGLAADVVIFDPETIIDRGTYADGRLSPIGVEHVIVSGQLVVEQGRRNNNFPGEVLKPLS
jgi:N-acyl-D-amino-acid deacylase